MRKTAALFEYRASDGEVWTIKASFLGVEAWTESPPKEQLAHNPDQWPSYPRPQWARLWADILPPLKEQP